MNNSNQPHVEEHTFDRLTALDVLQQALRGDIQIYALHKSPQEPRKMLFPMHLSVSALMNTGATVVREKRTRTHLNWNTVRKGVPLFVRMFKEHSKSVYMVLGIHDVGFDLPRTIFVPPGAPENSRFRWDQDQFSQYRYADSPENEWYPWWSEVNESTIIHYHPAP